MPAQWRTFDVVGEEFNKNIPSLSNIRWYNEHEVAEVLWNTFEKFTRFVRIGLSNIPNDGADDADYIKELRALERRLYSLVTSQPLQFYIMKLELLTYVTYGRPLAEACYFLEGDYPTLPHVRHYVNHCSTWLNESTYTCHLNPRFSLIMRL